ncbi:hypothetical protein D3C79_48210 [compost metagenome]
MGVTTNQPKSLEERVAAAVKAANERKVDFDICYIAGRAEWSTNWGEGYVRSNLSDLLELIEEDIRNPVPPAPDLPDEPEPAGWKL